MLCAGLPASSAACSGTWLTVDVIEDNSVRSPETGDETIHQVILWRYREHDGVARYYVVDWAAIHRCSPVDRAGQWWILRFGSRWVRGRIYRQTRSWHDWEVEDRRWLPIEERR